MTDRTRVVDVHSHFVTPEYAAAAVAAGHEHPDGMPGWPTWGADEHLRLMDEHGIERSVLSISSPGVHLGDDAAAAALARQVNDTAAELCRRHPDRFSFFAAVPLPDVDAAVTETRRAMDELGAVGVVTETHAHGRYVGGPADEPLLAELDARGGVLFVHPTSPPGAQAVSLGYPRPMLEFLAETTRAMTGMLLGGVLDRHPRLQVVATHCGGFLPLEIDRVALFADGFGVGGTDGASVREAMGRLWFDLAGAPVPNHVEALLRQVGTDRLLYGSDYCWTPVPAVAGQVRALDTQWDTARHGPWRDLARDNAQRLLAAVTHRVDR